MRTKSLIASLAVALAACTWVGAPARADRAVVVGVQVYVNLPRANTLRGCANDAKTIQAALESQGFKVTLLLNEKATKQGILDAIRDTGAALRPDERFVFYFAGHGRDMPETGLMPSDATDRGGSLLPEELHKAVLAVPAVARTVILDACFSGAMSRAIGNEEFRARYYAPEGSKSITPRPPNRQDTQEAFQKKPEVCYWTASQGNQQSIEGRFDGEYHGVFTNAAKPEIATKSQVTWGAANTDVKGKMADVLGNKFHQSPTITPAFVDAPIFSAGGGPSGQGGAANADSAPAQPALLAPTLWAQFNTDRVDPAMVSVVLEPNRSAFELGEPLVLRTTVGADGYLVLLERDVEDKVYLLYPNTPDADAAGIRAGQSIRVPPDLTKALQPETVGLEHVKAILFAKREQADAVLTAIPRSDTGVPFTGMKRLKVAPTAAAPFFTSEVTFSVVAKGEMRK